MAEQKVFAGPRVRRLRNGLAMTQTAMAEALGRSQNDYILDSYRGLFLQHREALGLSGADMVFAERDGGF